MADASRKLIRSKVHESPAWDRPGFLLWQALSKWRRDVTEALSVLNITYVQFSLLAGSSTLINRGGPPSQVELANYMAMDVMMTSQVVRSLERDGLIMREADQNDARVKRIVPTGKGHEVLSTAIGVVEEMNEEVFGLIEDIEHFITALQLVADGTADGRQASLE